MYDVTCRTCSNRVLVEKFSPVHTSVQWTDDSRTACPEFARLTAEGTDVNHVPSCLKLRDSIDEQVRLGNVPTDTYRVEPTPGRIG
ncbi:hypothetical protein [Gordonia sp. (in: high G+C Gram-positive bacteria)]|uniref:hypothetical protein n=1 Tax=Gordonia sp. (in: high G+C Gram-positive bacteria) TaxID=84139 RepID=UPI0016B11DFC|nr:hypothetical protein [Gordonia sp. (in: high G+C Gram-positive bacteria)]NLG48006.1 hypothetical protein [Gordonia sp. (in: high G+C Gram-positive bacteria)]